MAGHSFDTRAEHNHLSYIFEGTGDIGQVVESYARNLGTYVTEHSHADTIGHFTYLEVDGQFTSSGQSLWDLLNPRQELINRIENYQPVSEQFKAGMLEVERTMIGDRDVKQALFVSPIANDAMGEYSVIYYFTRDEHDPSKFNVNPITFRGSDAELSRTLKTLISETPALEGSGDLRSPAFVRSDNLLSKMDLFDAIRKTLLPSATSETKEYLQRLETDLSKYDQLESLQAHRIEYLRELALKYLKEGLKDGTFLQRLRDLADGAPELAKWLSTQEGSDPSFYNRPVRAPILDARVENDRVENVIEKELRPIFVMGWGDMARREAAAYLGIEKGENLPNRRYVEAQLLTQDKSSPYRQIEDLLDPLPRIAKDIYRSIVQENPLQPYPQMRSNEAIPSWLRDEEDLLRRARHQAFIESLIARRSDSHIETKQEQYRVDARVNGAERTSLFVGNGTLRAEIEQQRNNSYQSIRSEPLTMPQREGPKPKEYAQFPSASPPLFSPSSSSSRVTPDQKRDLPKRGESPTSTRKESKSALTKPQRPRRRERVIWRRFRLQGADLKTSRADNGEEPRFAALRKVVGTTISVAAIAVAPLIVKPLRFAARIFNGVAKFIFRKQPKTIYQPQILTPATKPRYANRILEAVRSQAIEFILPIRAAIQRTSPSLSIGRRDVKALDTKVPPNIRTDSIITKIQERTMVLSNVVREPTRVNTTRELIVPLVTRAIQESRKERSNSAVKTSVIPLALERNEAARALLGKQREIPPLEALKELAVKVHNATPQRVLADRKLETLAMLQEEARIREIDFMEFLSTSRVKALKKNKFYLESLILALLEALGVSEMDQLEILSELGIRENDIREISELLNAASQLYGEKLEEMQLS